MFSFPSSLPDDGEVAALDNISADDIDLTSDPDAVVCSASPLAPGLMKSKI